MTARLSGSLLLQPTDIQPSGTDLEVIGVFNPAVSLVDGQLVILARVAERPVEKRIGWTALPYWSESGRVAVDWVRDEDLHAVDARVVAQKSSGHLRLTSISHFQLLRQATLGSGAWEPLGSLLPEGPCEEYGIEDPRISKIDDTYWITYVAVSRYGAATALLSSTDLIAFQRQGIIFPSENKDVVLFPERIGGQYVALHRPNPNSHFSPPQIWLARSPDLLHWGQHEPLVSGAQAWEGDRIGSGTPPISTEQGWLTLYHGSAISNTAGLVGCYAAGALLLAHEDPSRVIARSIEPIMLPTTDFETEGFVPNVVFPTAMVDSGEDVQVFYGAADTCVAMGWFSKRSILDALVSQSGSTP